MEHGNLNIPGFGDVTECDELVSWVAGWKGYVLLSFEFEYPGIIEEKGIVNVTSKCSGETVVENRWYYVNNTTINGTIIVSGSVFPIISYDNINGRLVLKIANPDGGQGDLHVTLQKI